MNQSVIRRPSKALGLSILCVCVLYAGAMLLNMESFLFGRLQYKIAEPLVSSLLLIGVLAMSFLFGKYGGKRYVITLSAYLGISMACLLYTSLAAEDVGFTGIGWNVGSAVSRAAVHVDTRESPYRFDEEDGNRMVKGNSWYVYFGVNKPVPPGEAPDILYQVYTAANKWLAEITNYGAGSLGYAGFPNRPVQGVRARLSRGSIEYRVHLRGRWLPWVKDTQDYAGLYGKDADGLQMRLVGLPDCAVEYRVAAVGREYYPWVRDYGEGSDGYAGSFGKPFDRLQCRVVKK